MNTIVEDIKKLSISERIQPVEDIWNNIAEELPFSLELSTQERHVPPAFLGNRCGQNFFQGHSVSP